MNQTIEITNAMFQPKVINISAGTTVTWINRDATPNTVTALNGDFTSGSLATGQSYSHTFNTAGTFDYVVNNPQSRGTIRVTSGVTGTTGITQNQTPVMQSQTIAMQNQTIGAAGAPLVVRGQEPVVVGQTRPVEVRPQQAQVQVEQPQSVLVRTEPVITRGGANATQVTPQTVTGTNTTPMVVREEQPILVREPQQIAVQPQQVQVTVEQPQPVVVRTVPVVSMTGPATGNQTIGAANATAGAQTAQAPSVVILNRTGAATVPVVAQGTVPVVVGQTQPIVVQPQPAQIQIEQPQPVVVRTETVVTRSGTNANQVAPQIVPRTNQSSQVVSEVQQIVVREPQPVVVQPQPVQVSVEQPQIIVIRTVPVVTIGNQTIGIANVTANVASQAASAPIQNQTAMGQPTAGIAQTGIVGNATGGNQTPYIRASRQTITTDSVTIGEVYSNGPGWADVHTDLNGVPNPTNIIGFTHVNNGLNRNVVVVLNRTNNTNITDPLWAMLHIDAGRIGVHEYPGPDIEATAPNGTGIRVPFNVTAQGTRYRISSARSATSMTAAGNVSGAQAARTATPAARPANATTTAARNATATVNATRQAQAPVTPAAPAVSAPSTASGEPYVQASNQSVSSGQVTVAQASIQGPGWVAVQTDLNGNPGKILGYSHLNNGMNNNVAVMLQFTNQTNVTSVLWAQLYKDGGIAGKFEFPGPDIMATTSNGTQVRRSFGVTGADQLNLRKGTTGFAGAGNQTVIGGQTGMSGQMASGNVTAGNQTAAGGQTGMSGQKASGY
ncbi:MAG TPA: hypothetical protein VN455_06200 [Methanotrichaceae archaeon]|nr:hypothetical protein [Methanotrichaceae archaeon]